MLHFKRQVRKMHVFKMFSSNMVLQQVHGLLRNRLPLGGKQFHGGRARAAGARATLLFFEGTRQIYKTKCCGTAAILKMCFSGAMRQFRKKILLAQFKCVPRLTLALICIACLIKRVAILEEISSH